MLWSLFWHWDTSWPESLCQRCKTTVDSLPCIIYKNKITITYQSTVKICGHKFCDEKLLQSFNLIINLLLQNLTSVPICDDVSGTPPLACLLLFWVPQHIHSSLFLSATYVSTHTFFVFPLPPKDIDKRHLVVCLNFVQVWNKIIEEKLRGKQTGLGIYAFNYILRCTLEGNLYKLSFNAYVLSFFSLHSLKN